MEKIAFFDFDGTITKRDTLLDIVIYSFGIVHFLRGIVKLSPFFILFYLKVISNNYLKTKFISYFFKGLDTNELNNICGKYCSERLHSIIYKEALTKIYYFLDNNINVVIVSASPENWIKPWANSIGINRVIASKLECDKNNIVTGNLLGSNCFGQEKVNRIKEYYSNIDNYFIYAYGDSRGDKEMLSIANEPYYKIFKR